jgi:hypothetical protein
VCGFEHRVPFAPVKFGGFKYWVEKGKYHATVC